MAISYLTRAASGGNQKTYTISVWIKMSDLYSPATNQTANRVIIGSDISADAENHATLSLYNDGNLRFMNLTSNDWGTHKRTTRKLFDPTSWYHIVCRIDTTQSTADDRVRLYINGVQETSFEGTNATPDQNEDTGMFRYQTIIGARKSSSPDDYWIGNMAHMHICEGYSYAPTEFGETDSTTGEWKAKLNPSVSYGSHGAFLKFENAGALGTDSSGEGHTFTVNGDLKQSISTPSNLFATFNYLHNGVGQQNVISKAGTQIDHANDSYTGKITAATLGMNKGKWYWETKYSTTGGYLSVGFGRNGCDDLTQNMRGNKQLGDDSDGNGNSWAFRAGNSSGQIVKKLRHNNADAVADMGVTPAVNDIIQCWLDLDNGKAWWGINGTVMNSGSGVGVPNTGAYPHFTFTVGDEFYIPAVSLYGFNGAVQCQANFGEGRFGTTAVSSGVADNGGNGTFEYSPLAGFYSICTKNIKDYG
ncbi:putative lectin (SPRY) [uncultured Mediterranean phage uvMED]|nr:putative lectin (SPRY) [uncultured Mediterranean phage uvMED]BAR16531.1 spry domain protein [uncultured Mediterranean phage uvMED]